MRRQTSDFYQGQIDRLLNPPSWQFGVLFLLVVASVIFGVDYFNQKAEEKRMNQPIKAADYAWLQMKVEQCAPMVPQLKKYIQKGYVTEGEVRELDDICDEFAKSSQEEVKNKIIEHWRAAK
jgi:hypothetical protein